MKVRAWWAFYAVGGALAFFGLLLLLALPSTGVLVLLLALVHLFVGAVLRERDRRSTRTPRP